MEKVFSVSGYQSLLKTALDAGYTFVFFNEPAPPGKSCLLRHDIDNDLDAAMKIAEVEFQLGVKSTFFVMLRSPVYNLFGRHNHRCVERILELGHQLALHYDEAFYPDIDRSLQEMIEVEAEILGKMFSREIKVISFHQPGPRILKNEFKLKGFINTYDKDDMKGIFYISDSNMVWKHLPAWDLFKSATENRIQLLIHPMWWVGDGSQNTEVLWDKALLDNFNRTIDQVFETEGAFGHRRTVSIR
ncbi:MAG: hypothetical protein JST26_06105 [Bacteroidetes bacterium]|nr:hypothetical protein [Bacteroidota bacterium]